MKEECRTPLQGGGSFDLKGFHTRLGVLGIWMVVAMGALAQSDTTLNSVERIEHYRSLFGLECLDQKGTNNYGDGIEALYGTRNFRTVLHGVAYRGGGNNYYHRSNKRGNKNPLPPDGLKNLADLDFSAAVYLYTENFDTAPRQVEGANGTMDYFQISGNSEEQQEEILDLVYAAIQDPSVGPVYLHCWNGWHQSGYVSAILLRQFCGYSPRQSVKYWEDNTDGWNNGYKRVREAIADFKPRAGYDVDEATRAAICPCNNQEYEAVTQANEKIDWIRINMERTVQFDKNSKEIGPGALTAIDDYVEFMKAYPHFSVQVEGHCSKLGAADHNLRLSQMRADTVRQYMMAQGIDSTRLEAIGFGETQLMMTGDSQKAHDTNRRIEFAVVGINYNFEFAKNSAEIKVENQAELVAIKEIMESIDNGQFLITGHTDDSGSDEFNVRLSGLRAKSVQDYLVSLGMDASKLQTKGLGSSEPLVPNDSEANRELNRRIEIRIL